MSNSLITKRLTNEIKEKNALVNDLQRALSEVKTLQGIISICSYCRQIRNDAGSWSVLEKYLSENSDAKFSHGICPDCFKKEMAEIDEE